MIPGLRTSMGHPAQVCNHPEVAGPCSLTSKTSGIASCEKCKRWDAPAEEMQRTLADVTPLNPSTWSPKPKPTLPKPQALPVLEQCVNLGAATGKYAKCVSCTGTLLKVFSCAEFGECTINKAGEGIKAHCHKECPKYRTAGSTVESAKKHLGGPSQKDKLWLRSPTSTRSMRTLLDHAATNAPPPMPEMSGRGIVINGGGRYFELAYSSIYNLRKLGCTLPVELWHLGPEEMLDEWRQKISELGSVRVVDAQQVGPGARILCGWESKPYSIMYSAFEEVLLLDADNLAVRNPDYLFDAHEYRETGAIFWPDLDTGRVWIPDYVWDLAGIASNNRQHPAFETGQILINKKKCWKELSLTMHINEWSDCWYDFVYGDKDTFKLAWHKLGTAYTMPSQSYWRHPAIIQHDLSGRELFLHCCQGKDQIRNATPISMLPEDVSKNTIAGRCDLVVGWPTSRSLLEAQSKIGASNILMVRNTCATKALSRFLIYCDTRDKMITPWLQLDGFWEAWVTLAVTKIVQPGWRCVNVGAHFGYYSLLMAYLSNNKVIAFEPIPRHVELLKRSATDNGFEIDVRQKAVWNKAEKHWISYDPIASGGASLMNKEQSPFLEVECVVLDDEIEECDFLFIDAEGAEPEILEGARRLMKSCITVVEVDSSREYAPGWLESLEEEYHMSWLNHDGNIEPVTVARIKAEPGNLWMIHLVKKTK